VWEWNQRTHAWRSLSTQCLEEPWLEIEVFKGNIYKLSTVFAASQILPRIHSYLFQGTMGELSKGPQNLLSSLRVKLSFLIQTPEVFKVHWFFWQSLSHSKWWFQVYPGCTCFWEKKYMSRRKIWIIRVNGRGRGHIKLQCSQDKAGSKFSSLMCLCDAVPV
jgi:hypothetical protein